MPENKHLHLNSVASQAPIIIKFCYFILAILLIGCGNEKNAEKAMEENSDTEETTVVSENSKSKTILCFGDSITAGYGLDDSNEAYPALLQKKIDSLELNYTVINSGLSGETTAGGRSRLSWVMKQKVDIFLLELGGNDGLRGIPLTETKANLKAIIETIQTESPNTRIILAGMELPPNMGKDYTTEFRELFAEIASQYDVAFIPFILKDVGGIKALNQNDGIHPTAEGHKIVANTVWEVLRPMVAN
ncbi:arylesterase [Pukyongia salina]|uniref:Arylesterase n=1 Tax=Pukyongia salina TaxID=2094025 RepID=A0A2S0HZC4_9FLAO|nr:arylesterase [Pukyongia salina]AVI51968.1 arylesterase [Pukyongia salina]